MRRVVQTSKVVDLEPREKGHCTVKETLEPPNPETRSPKILKPETINLQNP